MQLTRKERQAANEALLSAEKARRLFNYDPGTGELTWKARASNRIKIGEQVGYVTKVGYRQVGVTGVSYLTHRIIWLMQTGKWPSGEIDHEGGYGGDNRWENLRDVTHRENACNTKLPSDNTSGAMGVFWAAHCGRWRATITVEGRTIHLGYHDIFEDAVAARKAAEIKYGSHKNHGRAE